MNDDEISKEIENSLVDEYINKSIDYLPNSLKFALRPIIARNVRILSQKVRPPKIALYGRSGSGKSSLVNSIIGKKVASVGVDKATTKKFESYRYERDGWRLEFVDSRGVGDSTSGEEFAQAVDFIVSYRVDILLFVFDIFITLNYQKVTEIDQWDRFIQQAGKLMPGAGIVLNVITAATVAALTLALGEAASKHFIEGVSIEDAKIIFESKNKIMKEKFITAFTQSRKDNSYKGIEEILKEFSQYDAGNFLYEYNIEIEYDLRIQFMIAPSTNSQNCKKLSLPQMHRFMYHQ